MPGPVFERAVGTLPNADEPVWWFIFRNRGLLLLKPVVSGDRPTVRTAGPDVRPDVPYATTADASFALPDTDTTILIGYRDGIACLAGTLASDAEIPTDMVDYDLRRLYGVVDEDLYGFASYASQVAYWHQTSKYCPVCGSRTKPNSVDWGRTCTACGHIGYPRVSPCAIVLIHDGADRVLLVRQPSWTAGMYSLVAGFVEPGESLENCVVREIREEIGVSVDQITYMGSQPWPFPHQLMVGYTACYAGGELRIEPTEIDDARWFHLDELPGLPPPLSIARQIINRHLAARQAQSSTSG